ncbi:MAG: hypothetical protein K8E66_05730 [Phycisphaerales bacterium]|nr:hypothetical protein [Phycisphaerales bacterium]
MQGLGTSAFNTVWPDDNLPYVHNMPAQILTEHGLIGAALLGVIMILVTRASLNLLKMFKDSPAELSSAAILIAVCLYQLLLSFKQGSFFTSAVPFWWFLILAKIHSRTMKDAKAHQAWEDQANAYEHPELYAAA